jgi:predicted AAA+ superfamily ATPase
MDFQLVEEINQLNPWLKDPSYPIVEDTLIPRVQFKELLDPEWDSMWTILIGPRRAGKTTLGKMLSQKLVHQKRFSNLLYLNCDFLSIRKGLSSTRFISEVLEEFSLKSPILFIDEVQRLENPGLFLKSLIDLNLPIKHIATGSSQLELKSKVQEFLTGRQISPLILPLSHEEMALEKELEQVLIFGCYPQVFQSKRKQIQIKEIYDRYIQKDIVEILKVGHPDIMQKLLTLLAHSSGQLINYEQLSSDCKVSASMIHNHLNILEQTFVIKKISPFVGNKRTEITSNPIYYFIDNGFRNSALRNFLSLESRGDAGLLAQNFVFQEIFKFQTQHFKNFDIHYWRTKSGAEVDFVLYQNQDSFIPVEVKYQNFSKPTISRGYRSFIEAYQPTSALIITKNYLNHTTVGNTSIHFIPLAQIEKAFKLIEISIPN